MLATVVIVLVFILQVPVLLEILKNCLPQYKLLHRLARHASDAMLFLLTCVMISIGFYQFHAIFLPFAYYPQSPYSFASGWIVSLAVMLVWLNGVYHFYKVVTTSPGVAISPADDGLVPPLTWCDMCQTRQALGTIHCRRCGTCVPHLCHHCPFALSCVGENNLLYFHSALTWAFLGSICACAMTFQPFFECYWNITHVEQRTARCATLGELVLMFGATSMIFCFLLFFWTFQSLLFVFNTSTVGVLARLNGGEYSQLFTPICQACDGTCSCGRTRISRWRHIMSSRRNAWWQWIVPWPATARENKSL